MTNYGGLDIEIWPDEPVDTGVDLGQLVVLSLFSNQRAENDDILPDDTGDPPVRGGWWADAFSDDKDLFGSRLWLFGRSELTDETTEGTIQGALEALQWMIDDGVCSAVDATITRNGKERLDLIVTVTKLNGENIELKFDSLWEI